MGVFWSDRRVSVLNLSEGDYVLPHLFLLGFWGRSLTSNPNQWLKMKSFCLVFSWTATASQNRQMVPAWSQPKLICNVFRLKMYISFWKGPFIYLPWRRSVLEGSNESRLRASQRRIWQSFIWQFLWWGLSCFCLSLDSYKPIWKY